MFEQQVLRPEEFALFKKLMYERTGIFLNETKLALVANRLRARLRLLKLPSYRAYYEYARGHEDELTACIDAITTNETYFFREPRQWAYFETDMLPALLRRNAKTKTLRIWSAACSTGEEPYSVAIFLKEHLPPGWRPEITGSDINSEVLARAKAAVYRPYAVAKTDPALVRKYFTEEKTDPEGRPAAGSEPRAAEGYRLSAAVRAMVRLEPHNLLKKKPSGKFDVILCRNVLIYFNDESKRRVLANLYDALTPGGYLLLGAAEGMLGMNLIFKPLRLSVYQRTE